MPRIFGVITDRLLKQHGESSSGWNPPRVTKAASKSATEGSKGRKMGKGEGRTKQ